jgi:hypothetical protein
MIWAAISWHSAGPNITVNGQITTRDYMDSLDNPVLPMVQMLFPNDYANFQDENLLIHTSRSVHSWFEEHEDAVQHLPWPGKSPDLNIFEPLWSVLESRVRSGFPPPSSHKQLEDVRH